MDDDYAWSTKDNKELKHYQQRIIDRLVTCESQRAFLNTRLTNIDKELERRREQGLLSD
jgi:hypothetical protein